MAVNRCLQTHFIRINKCISKSYIFCTFRSEELCKYSMWLDILGRQVELPEAKIA